MISYKAFASHLLLTSNVRDVVAPVGELSAWSMTYATDRAIQRRTEADPIVLTVFSCKRDSKHIDSPTDLTAHVLSVVDWLYKKRITAGAGKPLATDILSDLLDQFGKDAKDFKVGPISGTDTCWMPEWASWVKLGSEETEIRIWFSDQSFQDTYDEYEIIVVPPVAVLNDFFKIGSQVERALNARTVIQRTEAIQAAKLERPETVIRTERYDYFDPNEPGKRVPTYWDVLIYGEHGNNIDSIKDAIVNYLLKESGKPRSDWLPILPDLFSRTEFIIHPFWNKYAIPNRVTQAGIYAPTLDVGDIVNELVTTSGYTKTHTTKYAQVSSHPYRSITLAIIGNQENRESKYRLTDFYPDYIAQSSTSQDFNRQSEPTRQFSETLANAILAAETMTAHSDIPRGFTRLIRGDKVFCVFSMDNVHYLVSAKINLS